MDHLRILYQSSLRIAGKTFIGQAIINAIRNKDIKGCKYPLREGDAAGPRMKKV